MQLGVGGGGASVTASKLANGHLRLGTQMLQYPISQMGKWRLCQVKEVAHSHITVGSEPKQSAIRSPA